MKNLMFPPFFYGINNMIAYAFLYDGMKAAMLLPVAEEIHCNRLECY